MQKHIISRPYHNQKIHGESFYGMHLVATFYGLNERLLSIPAVANFLVSLADRIQMERYGEPVVARFGEGQEVGLSGVQLITTSQISLHTNDEFRDLYLDVFSCKSFMLAAVLDEVEQHFGPADSSHYQVLMRK